MIIILFVDFCLSRSVGRSVGAFSFTQIECHAISLWSIQSPTNPVISYAFKILIKSRLLLVALLMIHLLRVLNIFKSTMCIRFFPCSKSVSFALRCRNRNTTARRMTYGNAKRSQEKIMTNSFVANFESKFGGKKVALRCEFLQKWHFHS